MREIGLITVFDWFRLLFRVCSGWHSTAPVAKLTFAGSVCVAGIAELKVDQEPADDTHRIPILFCALAMDAQAFAGWIRDQLLTTV